MQETPTQTPPETASVVQRVLTAAKKPQYMTVIAILLFALSASGTVLALHTYESMKKPATSPASSSSPSQTTHPGTASAKPATKTPDSPKDTAKAAPGTSTLAASAGKVFALLDPGESSANMQAYASKASVDGLAFRARWSDLEPSADSYNWSSLDSALTTAGSSGKKMTIHVGASSGGYPNWLTGMGMKTYTYTIPAGSRKDPIPWDSVYIQHYNQFVAALGQHVTATGKQSVVEHVSVGAPVAEMTIAGCANGQLQGGTAYDRTLYMNTWKSTIAANASAFPGKKVFVSLPLAFICQNDGNDGKAFATELMNSTKTTASVSYFAADLNALGSTRTAQADSSLKASQGINYQTIWSYTSDPQSRFQGSLSSGVCYGWKAGARYYELYKSDLTSISASVINAIAQARSGAGC